MATSYKQLGTSLPGASLTVLYTVPGSTSAVVSSIIIANIAATDKTYRICVIPTSGTTVTSTHYIAYDAVVPANNSVILSCGMSLATGYTIKVYGSDSNVTFNAFGAEIV